MGLPRKTHSYDRYTDRLVYFGARLAADPETAPLAAGVEALLSEIDEAEANLRLARRAEVLARARRDHQHRLADEQVRRLKRRVEVIHDRQITARLFPRGIDHTLGPRGRPLLERLAELAQAIDQLAASPATAAHAQADELAQVLEHGATILVELIATLTPTIEAVEAEVQTVAHASEAFNFRRTAGVARLGVVLGELRAKLRGDAKAAYAYTRG